MTGAGDNQRPLTVGAYQICRRLGGGGEGEVYLVRHIPTEQLRAAKILKSETQGRQMHEIHMMKRLHHPSLPQILDVFQWEGRIWLVMEYIQGKALSDIQGSNMTGERFFKIARELAEALMYLHSRKMPVLHLDIKPSNVLVKQDGHLTLIDFGASVLSSGGERAENCFGTRGFAAPEQFEGDRAGIDGRADIYGFGATMYYCLHGRIPEGGTQRRRERQLQKLYSGRPAYWKRRAGTILEKCLQRDRSRRYPDIPSLYQDICRAEQRYIRRKRAGEVMAAAAFFGLVTAFAAGAWMGSSSEGAAADSGQKCQQLLEMASGLGLAQSQSLYEEAAGLQPGGNWGLVLLARLTEDYLFTLEEEGMMKALLYSEVPGTDETVAEVMHRQPEMFGEFSYRLGLAYWYFYQEAGGKRAAASWFSQAMASQEGMGQPAGWLEAARIYADIGSYYEKLGRRDEEGRRQADFQTYWRDLKRLWELESLREGEAVIRRQMALEILSCLIMGAYEVRQSGESRTAVGQIMNELAGILQDEGNWPDDEQREVAAGQYRDAEAAVERAFADERGQEFEREQESAG